MMIARSLLTSDRWSAGMINSYGPQAQKMYRNGKT
jgi:hypothetical protein